MSEYWLYENWAVGRARYHIAGCAHAEVRSESKYGRWHGPFRSVDEVLTVPLARRAGEALPCAYCFRPDRPSAPRGRLDGAPSQRLDRLIASLDRFLDAFDRRGPFTTEQVAVHRDAITRRAAHASPSTLLNDDEFARLLIEVLRAWGMDYRAARLLEREQIMANLRAEEGALSRLWDTRLTRVPPSSAAAILTEVRRLMETVRVSATRSNVVAASKALHHVLPDLIPPIDRRYTLAFFGFGTVFRERAAIERCVAGFHQIAQQCPEIIESRIGSGMHTSIGKVIDNAIVGYVASGGTADEAEITAGS